MPATRAWDRAAALPVPAGDRPRPEIAALGADLPSIERLFSFMRDAELRFATLRMRIEETGHAAAGNEVSVIDLVLRHPGEAKVLTTTAGHDAAAAYDVWASDGETIRTYSASHKLGTRRRVRAAVRGLNNPDLPGTAKVYMPRTDLPAESLPDVFVHPAGYCQNVLATGNCRITGTTHVAGREAIVVECTEPRTIESVADRPDFRIEIAVDRADGVILRLLEAMGPQVTREAVVVAYEPDAALAPGAFAFNFPADTIFIY